MNNPNDSLCFRDLHLSSITTLISCMRAGSKKGSPFVEKGNFFARVFWELEDMRLLAVKDDILFEDLMLFWSKFVEFSRDQNLPLKNFFFLPKLTLFNLWLKRSSYADVISLLLKCLFLPDLLSASVMDAQMTFCQESKGERKGCQKIYQSGKKGQLPHDFKTLRRWEKM